MDDGLYVSAHSQTVWQTREIDTDKLGYYEGKSFVPVMPSLLVNWHRGNFALSGGFYIIGGGGEAKFDKGFPDRRASFPDNPEDCGTDARPSN